MLAVGIAQSSWDSKLVHTVEATWDSRENK